MTCDLCHRDPAQRGELLCRPCAEMIVRLLLIRTWEVQDEKLRQKCLEQLDNFLLGPGHGVALPRAVPTTTRAIGKAVGR